MSDRREQSKKLYVVRDVSSGNGLYVKAKSKLAALKFAMNEMYSVDLVQSKDAEVLAKAIAEGTEIHEA